MPALTRTFLPAHVRATGPAQVRTLGLLQVSTYREAARSFVRPVEDTTGSHLTLGVHSSGRATLVRGDRTAACRPDDLFVCDGAVPFLPHESLDFELHLVRIRRGALTLTGRQVRALSARATLADGPVAPLLGPLLRTFLDALPAYPPATPLRLATTVTAFVGSLAVEDAEDAAGPVDAARTADAAGAGTASGPGQEQQELLLRVRAHVDARLWDRTLSPATIATARHIPVRYLHKLFEGQGSTIGRWIQHRRLEEARRELARPEAPDVAVGAVAKRWGFANATHFGRSFRAAYGVSPREWRNRTRPSEDSAGGNG
ncbi:helix-turn-helix domain-containing protein [Streptomyces sp. Ru62]|uniref:helix-turn-helix domain-containing protein n=1 Tax=Streptomyces sp. Ru62 TaxID=2080745 RepID=UPI0021563ABD|nr:helix-turn-helix domain-containing protein [Streptomyces sp. Ru62]